VKVALIKSMSLSAEQGTAEGNCRRPHPVGSFFEGMVEWWMAREPKECPGHASTSVGVHWR
jgi:hypothetical protein